MTRSAGVAAPNPIVPPGVYLADPKARTWDDGRVYVYGSRDESPGYYCSNSYDVLSSVDLRDWRLHPRIFAVEGVPLSAVTALARDGRYHLYYSRHTAHDSEGVAIAEAPDGPFCDGRPIDLGGREGIDPAVFVDDDGAVYYLWGQFSANMAKLNPDLRSLDPGTVREGVVTERDHFFHEGAFLTKRAGLYYLVYAHMGRAGRPTCLGYAASRAPTGPYTYRGVIIDNDHCDPAVWNNHGSIVEIGDRWYVFYHRSTHGSKSMRKACVERISFGADGSIAEVEMTTQGAGAPLAAREPLDAARACLLYGHVRIEAIGGGREMLGQARDGDAAAYKYLDFGGGVSSVTVRAAATSVPTRLEVALDQSWGPVAAVIEVPGGGDGINAADYTVVVKEAAGVRAVWWRFAGAPGADLARVDSFVFA